MKAPEAKPVAVVAAVPREDVLELVLARREAEFAGAMYERTVQMIHLKHGLKNGESINLSTGEILPAPQGPVPVPDLPAAVAKPS